MYPKVACILKGDPATYRIRVGARAYEFEWHYYCGPTALGKRGDVLSVQPQSFLDAACWWDEQGRKVDAEGFCVWEKPDPFKGMKLKHLGGKHWLVVSDTESADASVVTAEPTP